MRHTADQQLRRQEPIEVASGWSSPYAGGEYWVADHPDNVVVVTDLRRPRRVRSVLDQLGALHARLMGVGRR